MKNYIKNQLQSVMIALLSLLLILPACGDDSSPTGAGGNGGNGMEGVWYVDADAAGKDNGKSWEDAFPTLQAAVDSASAGDQVWVAEGTYTSPDDTDPTIPVLAMKKKVNVYGGFGGTEKNLSGRDYQSNTTTLDGEHSAYHVVTGADSALLEGFTITGGRALGEDQNQDRWGGGMLNYDVSPTVANCIFTGNSAGRGGGMYSYNFNGEILNCEFTFNSSIDSTSTGDGGGGMYTYYSHATVTGCAFTNNTSQKNGGGMMDDKSSSVIDSCSFNNNTAEDYGGGIHVNGFGSMYEPDITNCTVTGCGALSGGGIYNNYSEAVISGCTVTGNTCEEQGGGVFINASEAQVIDCLIASNTSEYTGGGICNYSYSSPNTAPEIKNCMIRGNSATDDGGGIYNENNHPDINLCTITGNTASNRGGGIFNRDSSPVFVNIISWGNDAGTGSEIYNFLDSDPEITYSDIQGGYPGSGNIYEEPLWVSGPDGNYYLSHTICGQSYDSGCVNAGSTTAEALGMVNRTTRTDGGPDTGQVDMGYHYR